MHAGMLRTMLLMHSADEVSEFLYGGDARGDG